VEYNASDVFIQVYNREYYIKDFSLVKYRINYKLNKLNEHISICNE